MNINSANIGNGNYSEFTLWRIVRILNSVNLPQVISIILGIIILSIILLIG